MTLKLLMVDVDGVLLGHPEGLRWDRDMERDLGIKPELIQEHFFKPHWPDILRGKACLDPVLSDVLATVAPDVGAERFKQYWFARDADRNEALFEDIAQLRETGIVAHLATDQEHARAAYLWKQLEFERHFDAMHYAAEVGATKLEPEFYRIVTARTGLPASAIGFIDDRAGNIDAARCAGWLGYVWTPRSRLHEALQSMRV